MVQQILVKYPHKASTSASVHVQAVSVRATDAFYVRLMF